MVLIYRHVYIGMQPAYTIIHVRLSTGRSNKLNPQLIFNWFSFNYFLMKETMSNST